MNYNEKLQKRTLEIKIVVEKTKDVSDIPGALAALSLQWSAEDFERGFRIADSVAMYRANERQIQEALFTHGLTQQHG